MTPPSSRKPSRRHPAASTSPWPSLCYGPDHDAALHAYQAIEQSNANEKVVPFGSQTDPQVIARALLRMIE